MTNLPILTYPNPDLRRKAREIPVEALLRPENQQLIDDLIETMKLSRGSGIAATQVGNLWRIFIVSGENKDPDQIFVNPKMIMKSSRMSFIEEGCLSVPGIYGIVERHAKVRIKALDRSGKSVDVRLSGWSAKVVQHEIDHLDGVLFIDKVQNITQGSLEQ